jgi:hypothetical protein
MALALAALLLACGPASAQPFNYRYEFNLPGGTPASTFTIPATAQNVSLALYLVETATGGTVLRSQGLFSVASRLSYPGGLASVQSIAEITRNPQFDQQLGTSADALSAVLNEQTLGANVVAPAADPTRILIGTFRLTRAGIAGGNVTLTAADPGPSSDTLSGTGTVLDGQIQSATATLTIAPVPEPTSLLLGGLAAAGLAATRRRRKGNTASECVSERTGAA